MTLLPRGITKVNPFWIIEILLSPELLVRDFLITVVDSDDEN
jgi:hypothetical protein